MRRTTTAPIAARSVRLTLALGSERAHARPMRYRFRLEGAACSRVDRALPLPRCGSAAYGSSCRAPGVVRPVDSARRTVLRMDRHTAHEQSAPLSSHRPWGVDCARGLLLRAQLNVAARPGTCSRAPVGQATRVGPAATGGRITAGPRLPCSVGTSKRLLALDPIRDLAGRTKSGTRVLRPPAAVAGPKSGSPRAQVDTLCQTP
jgi:hypothetical protein